MQPFMRRPKRMLLGVALAALCLASAGVGRADSPVYQRMLRSTGLVEVPHPKGWVTYGTCWLVDRQRGLALTSQHVVGGTAEAVVYYPAYRNGAAIPELAHHHRQVAAVYGRVVHREMRRDRALLQLRALPGPGPPGERAAGGPHDRDPVAPQRGGQWRATSQRPRRAGRRGGECGETKLPGGRHRGDAALLSRSRAGSAWGGEVGPKQLWHRVPSFVTVGWGLYSLSPPLRNPRLLA